MAASKMTTVNFDMLAVQLTPVILRKPTWKALMRVLMMPFKRIGNQYLHFKGKTIQRMSYNGQVRLLENIVNRMMVGSYDKDNPAIYIDEPEPAKEFLVSPDGGWQQQNSLHFDKRAKDNWDFYNSQRENAEDFSIPYRSDPNGLGFEVHLTQQLSSAASANRMKTLFYANGGQATLEAVVDTYKLAGKRYVVIQD